MSKLPQVSDSDVVGALLKLGFTVRRQHGSHLILRRNTPFAQRQAEITADEFSKLL